MAIADSVRLTVACQSAHHVKMLKLRFSKIVFLFQNCILGKHFVRKCRKVTTPNYDTDQCVRKEKRIVEMLH